MIYYIILYFYEYVAKISIMYIQYIYSILGVARHTDVTVRYVPWFGGHGSIRFRYNMKKKEIYARFLFIYFEQTVVQIKKNPSRCENTTYYMLYIKICFVFNVSVHK